MGARVEGNIVAGYGPLITVVGGGDIELVNNLAVALGIDESTLRHFLEAWVEVISNKAAPAEVAPALDVVAQEISTGNPDPARTRKALEMLQQVALNMAGSGAVVGLQQAARHLF